MKTNIKGLLMDPSTTYTPQEIKREKVYYVFIYYGPLYYIGSMRVYFKSLKNRRQREAKGTQTNVSRSQRRRQRMFNVRHFIQQYPYICTFFYTYM